jgi:excisionase family DNA binding protein
MSAQAKPNYQEMNEEFYANPPEYVHTIDGLAKLYEVSVPTIYAWIASGHLPEPIKLGRKSFIRERDLQKKYDDLAGNFFEGNSSHAMAQHAARVRHGKEAA